jgi:hypothetical protein
MSETATEDKRLKAYETLVSLYDKAEPIIHRIADLNTFKYGELPLNPYMLVEAGITLRMVLDALKKMHNPQDRELSLIQREFETALTNCIRAAESTEKYVEYSGTSRSRMILNNIVNSTVMANEYIESVSKRLDAFKGVNIIVPQSHPVPEVKEKVKKPVIIKEEPKPVYHEPAKKKSGGFVHALDKIGDIIIFPIVKMAEITDLDRKTDKKKDK